MNAKEIVQAVQVRLGYEEWQAYREVVELVVIEEFARRLHAPDLPDVWRETMETLLPRRTEAACR